MAHVLVYNKILDFSFGHHRNYRNSRNFAEILNPGYNYHYVRLNQFPLLNEPTATFYFFLFVERSCVHIIKESVEM